MKLILHNTEMAGTQAAVVAFLFTVIFSAATYWGIERHMARLRRRLHSDAAG